METGFSRVQLPMRRGDDRKTTPLSPGAPAPILTAFKISAVYAVLGGAWILFSDTVLSLFLKDPLLMTRLQTIKGWLFIMVTASILYLLIRRDTTSRERSEEALKESERKYRFVVDNALVGIYTTNLRGEFLYANEAFVRMAEFESVEALMSENALARYRNPAERAVLIETLKKTGRVNNYEIEMLTKAGNVRNIIVNVVLEGDVLSGIVLDVTERKRADEALREIEERFRLLVEQVTDYEIFMLNPDGVIVSWNVGAELSKGYRAAEVIGKHHSIFFTPEDIRKGVPEQELLVATMANRFEDEGWRVRKDGTLFWGNVVTTSLRDRDGRLRGFLKVVRDITDRKRAEEDLRESEERYRVIAETASDAIITIDEESKIMFANPASEKVFGYRPDELIGREITMVMPERLRDAHLVSMRRYLETGKPSMSWKSVEVPGLRKDGSEAPLEISYGQFAQDEKRFFTGIIRDITERKVAEKEREYKQMLERFNQELESLVSERTMSLMALTLADRVRNPASVIRWTCNRILGKGDVPEKVRASLKAISDESDNLEVMVKDFQDLLKSKRSLFRYEDVNGVVSAVLSVTQREAANKRVQVASGLSEEPLRMNMQTDLLRIAVFNLLRNAIEATPEGGRIMVLTAGEDNRIVLTVSDSGSGIPKDMMGKIFDPFFSTKESRFGMGLPLVKQIVSEHMGEIEVKSEAGKGTTFILSFPVRWSEKAGQDRRAEPDNS